MKKYLNVLLLARFVLGVVFIYAGLYKILNPESFEKTLHAYSFFSNPFFSHAALILPWAQLILGALLVSGYLPRYVASIISALLLIFIVMNILIASKGSCQACGFLSELVFYKRGNPFILLTINYLLLALSGTIVMGKQFSPSKARFSFSKQVVLPLSVFFVVFLVLALFTFIGRRSYERNYIFAASGERNRIIKELNQARYLSLIGTNIKAISNIEFPINPDIKIVVMLTLHSLDCGNCAAEAAYLEFLNGKYGRQVFFCAVVRKIGKTAIDHFRSEHFIMYPFIEDPTILDSEIFSRFKSLIVTFSPDSRILRIDPIDFNIGKFQDEYENVLLSYLK